MSSLLMSKINGLCGPQQIENGMGSNTDQRHELRRDVRHQRNVRLFFQIVSCDEPDLVGTTVYGHVMDASANGLKIRSEGFIPLVSRLDLWVDSGSRPGKYFLTSHVKWSSNSKDGFYQSGVELGTGATTDIIEWQLKYKK